MQEINHQKGKIYYSMGEVSEMFDVNASLLRFWEQEFDILKPHRNKKGNRLFTPEDVDNIRIIYHLLKERKMKIEVARKQIKNYGKEVNRDVEITERLMEIRAILLEIKQDLAYDGEVIEEVDNDDIDNTAIVTTQAAKTTKKSTKPATQKIINQKQETTTIIEIESDVKPPFEEQTLFEVAVPLELLQNHETENDGFESAKAAFMGEETEQEQSLPNIEEKPRPQIIEQTLF